MFWPLRSNFLRSQSREVHFWNQNVLSSASFLVAIFNFFVFIEGIVSKNKLFPCNMVDLFCTFHDCNVYNFILFLHFYSFIIYYSLHLFIEPSILLFSILQEKNSTAVQTNISPKSLVHATYCCIKSSSSQLLLSNSLFFRFKSKNESILKIWKARHLKVKRLPRGKWNYFAEQFFFCHPVCVQPNVVN